MRMQPPMDINRRRRHHHPLLWCRRHRPTPGNLRARGHHRTPYLEINTIFSIGHHAQYLLGCNIRPNVELGNLVMVKAAQEHGASDRASQTVGPDERERNHMAGG